MISEQTRQRLRDAAIRNWAEPTYRKRRQDMRALRQSSVFQEAMERGEKFAAGYAWLDGAPQTDENRIMMVLYPSAHRL